ncbi:MAG: helix-turn-helix domain-containing protein [Clostridia bacterium]
MVKAFEIKKYAHGSDLKSRALSILMHLIDRMDNLKRTCFPSITTIANQLHISVSTVKRAMKELYEKGFLKREARFSEKKNGAQTSNLYTVATPSEQKQHVATKYDENDDESFESETEDQVETSQETCVEEKTEKISKIAPVEVEYISFETIKLEYDAKLQKSSNKFDRKSIWKEE